MLGMTSIPNEFSRRLWDRTLLSGIRHFSLVPGLVPRTVGRNKQSAVQGQISHAADGWLGHDLGRTNGQPSGTRQRTISPVFCLL